MHKIEILNIVDHNINGKLFLYVWLTDGLVHIWPIDGLVFHELTLDLYRDLIHLYYE